MPINHPIMDGNIIHHPLKMQRYMSKRHPATRKPGHEIHELQPHLGHGFRHALPELKDETSGKDQKNHPPLGKSMGITIPMGLNYNGLGSLWDEKFKKQQLQKLLIMQWLGFERWLRGNAPLRFSFNDQTATVSFGACWHSFRFNMLRWTDKQYLFERWQPRSMRTTWRPSMP